MQNTMIYKKLNTIQQSLGHLCFDGSNGSCLKQKENNETSQSLQTVFVAGGQKNLREITARME